jgi:hypothetical protein
MFEDFIKDVVNGFIGFVDWFVETFVEVYKFILPILATLGMLLLIVITGCLFPFWFTSLVLYPVFLPLCGITWDKLKHNQELNKKYLKFYMTVSFVVGLGFTIVRYLF